jgi:hypothetical protein
MFLEPPVELDETHRDHHASVETILDEIIWLDA